MKKTFYSNGKLLITGEYVVLDGATAFALPTKFGQDMTVTPLPGEILKWTSYDNDGSVWFTDEISLEALATKPVETDSVKTTLTNILHEALKLNPGFFKSGFVIETRLGFPRFWGLGTSSTLINNIAQWMQVDPYRLLHNSFGGSGYDIAVAQTPKPLLYTLVNGFPKVEAVDFSPEFAGNLYFVYLNQKQSSKSAIASYLQNRHSDLDKITTTITSITHDVLTAQNVGVFARLMQKHEAVLSDVLEMETVGERFFPDFDGVVKSLGAWGGDFILAVSMKDPTEYFDKRGFNTVIPYTQMIL